MLENISPLLPGGFHFGDFGPEKEDAFTSFFFIDHQDGESEVCRGG